MRLPARGKHRAVKVQRYANQTKSLQSGQHYFTAYPANLDNARVINLGQDPAEGGNIRKLAKPQKTKHHEVIPVVVHVPKATIAQYQMHYQHKNNRMTAKHEILRQMIKTGPQSGLAIQSGKQRLNDYQPGKRSEPLIFKTKLRNAMETRENFARINA